MGNLGAIAGGHEHTARAGAEVLADGGNAIDAAVAAVCAACTCEPTLTGPGGAGFATLWLADGRAVVLDFFASVPGIGRAVASAGGPVPIDVLFGATTQTFHVGPHSCAVPGFVAGVLGMHERFGRLPRSRVLEYGIELARSGLELTPEQAYCHHLLEGILRRRPEGESVFCEQGRFLAAGDHFAQPRLGDTLEQLSAGGIEAFYRGDIASEILRWSRDNDGLITADDLASYRVREHAPVRSTYRGLDFISPPPPSSGGVLVAYALRMLDALRPEQAADLDPETPSGARRLVASMIAANAVRGASFDGYLYDGGLVEWLLGDEQVERGVEIARGLASGETHPSSRLGSTTHVSVIDAEGNAVAMTTSTGCGSGEFVTDTGIQLNNMMGEEDLVPVERALHPGDRLTSMMAPSIVLSSGVPRLATGSAGSNRLRSAIVQSLVRAMDSRDYGSSASLQERLSVAVRAPRMHAEGGTVHVEPGLPETTLAALEEHGHHLNRWPGLNMYFGGTNMVAVDDDGSFGAAGDPRRGGGAFLVASDGTLHQR